jgi:hypothetical protein
MTPSLAFVTSWDLAFIDPQRNATLHATLHATPTIPMGQIDIATVPGSSAIDRCPNVHRSEIHLRLLTCRRYLDVLFSLSSLPPL